MSDTGDKPSIKELLLGRKRMLVFVGIIVCAAIGFALFGGHKQAMDTSTLRRPPTLEQSTLAAPPTAQYSHDVEESNHKQMEEAQRTGDSVSPTITLKPKDGTLPSLDTLDNEEGPPVRPTVRPDAEPAHPVPPPPQQVSQPPAEEKPVQIDSALASAMQRQMASIAKAMDGQPASTEWFYEPKNSVATDATGSTTGLPAIGANGYSPVVSQAAAPSSALPATSDARPLTRFKVPAPATILYAHLIGAINSDVPGPVVAQVDQGPFSGSRILGSFEFTEQGVIVKFHSMTVPFTEEGEQKTEVMTINAVAVDPSKLGSSLASDIDHHLLLNIGIGAATAFLQGFGQAVSQSGSTAVTNPYGGTTVTNPVTNTSQQLWVAGGAAAANAGNIFQRMYGNRRTTVTVDADTPFGLLFLGNGN